MDNCIVFELRINPKYYKEIYRIIKIDGSATLDDLSHSILSAFNFDDDHLYMFSMNRKRYDSEGYYHPQADGGKNAAKAKLSKLNLNVRNKFMFLYDFGDEWMFEITVKKIKESNIRTMTCVVESQGEISQYPDWDEIYDHEDESNYEDYTYDGDDFEECESEEPLVFNESEHSMIKLLSRNNPSDLVSMMKVLGIEPPDRKRGVSYAYAEEITKNLILHKEKILDLISPCAAMMLVRIIEKDKDTILSNSEQLDKIEILKSCGLLEIHDDYDCLTISVVKEAQLFVEFLKTKDVYDELNQNYKLDISASAMMDLYGVIEVNYLHKLLCEFIDNDIDSEILEAKLLKQKSLWREINIFVDEGDTTSMASTFNKEETGYVLERRKKYNISEYKKFENEEIDYLICGGMSLLIPSYGKLAEHVLMEKFMHLEIFALLCAELSKACMLGMNKEEIFAICDIIFSKGCVKFTKKIKNMVLEIIDQHPNAIFKGYSFCEYIKNNNTVGEQLSLFD